MYESRQSGGKYAPVVAREPATWRARFRGREFHGRGPMRRSGERKQYHGRAKTVRDQGELPEIPVRFRLVA